MYAKKCNTQHLVEAIQDAYDSGVENLAIVLDSEEYLKQCDNEQLHKACSQLFESFELYRGMYGPRHFREGYNLSTSEDFLSVENLFASTQLYVDYLYVTLRYHLCWVLKRIYEAELNKKANAGAIAGHRDSILKSLKVFENSKTFTESLKKYPAIAEVHMFKVTSNNFPNLQKLIEDKVFSQSGFAPNFFTKNTVSKGLDLINATKSAVSKDFFVLTFCSEVLENPRVQQYLTGSSQISGGNNFGKVDKAKLIKHNDDQCYHVWITALNLPVKGAIQAANELFNKQRTDLICLAGVPTTDYQKLTQDGAYLIPNGQFAVMQKLTGKTSQPSFNFYPLRVYDKSKFLEDISGLMLNTFNEDGDQVAIHISEGVRSLLGDFRNTDLLSHNGGAGGKIVKCETDKTLVFPKRDINKRVAPLIADIIEKNLNEKDPKKLAESNSYSWMLRYNKNFIDSVKDNQDSDGFGSANNKKNGRSSSDVSKTIKGNKKPNSWEQESQNNSSQETPKALKQGSDEEIKEHKKILDWYAACKYKWVAFMIVVIHKQTVEGLYEKTKDANKLDLSLLKALISEADKATAAEYVKQMGGEIFLEMYNTAKKFADKLKEKMKNAQKMLEDDKKLSEEARSMLKVGTSKEFQELVKAFEQGAY